MYLDVLNNCWGWNFSLSRSGSVHGGGEPITLNSCPPLEYEKSTRINSSNWVLEKVKEIRHLVGISCEGFEGEFMALFTAIEAGHYKNETTSSSKMRNRKSRELKRLSCFINYDSKGGSYRCGRIREGQ